MSNLELVVRGWSNGDSSQALFDMIHNEENLEFIASERAPYGLQEEVSRLTRERNKSADTHVKPSALWVEFILEGYVELRKRWRGNPDTDVASVKDSLFSAVFGTRNCDTVYDVFDAYTSQMAGMRRESEVAVLIPDVLHIDSIDGDSIGETDDDELLSFCNNWGFDFGDFCCICAGIATNRHGGSVDVSKHIELLDRYVRAKVWLIKALAAYQSDIPQTAQEQAEDILYDSHTK